MILSLVVAASVAAQPPPATPASPSTLKDASHAIEAGRLEEAKLIIGRAIAGGATGAAVERVTADLAFAAGDYPQALAAYQRLSGSPEKQPSDCEKGAISALEIGRITEAKPLVECAVTAQKTSWRAWNARGVLADLTNDWAMADEILCSRASARAR